ncbi:hypothetical protein ACFUJR_04900 [Streptomyces sp. NPDC057271]|uniref:hypothetical protein n=1 Tax=unclassified Streptomyces TaxID=2593676 RepID=UPI0036357903
MAGDRQRARIMITVKTYPELSSKYRETSCVAGIRLDQGRPQHVRLFPVPFRLLEQSAQFTKYSIIEVDVRPHHGDRRPESLRPDLETLEVIEQLPTSDGWKRRYSYVEPLVARSLCAIKRDQETNGTSLGIFRPTEITDFRLTEAEPWPAGKAALADQLDLFDQDLRRLEWVPFEFRYRFRCADDACTGHDMGLKDWEAGESYRKFRRTYGGTGRPGQAARAVVRAHGHPGSGGPLLRRQHRCASTNVHAVGALLPPAEGRRLRPGRPVLRIDGAGVRQL